MKAVLFVLALIALVAVVTANKERYEYHSQLVRDVNSKQSLWKAELNTQLLDGDYVTIKNLLGDLSVGSKSELPEKTTGWSIDVKDLPDSYMAYEGHPQCASMMKTVHDQSACGSCWASSTAAAASERYCMKTGRADLFLSSRDLLSCCSSCGFGCSGGYPSSAWSYIKNTGLVTGSPNSNNSTLCVRYPFLSCQHHTEGSPQCSDYDFDTPSCQKKCDAESSWPISYTEDKIRFSSSYSISGEANIMKELFENGPMTLSYSVYEDFLSYKKGIYKHTSGKSLGGHAVTLEGWGVEDGVKYWVVKNNWNSSWAENGYFRIVRGVNECGCESGLTAGKP